jgi:2-polyprenyl-6-methoxyphenol hydroxylase-like FAD-dependent oxidoreductase
MADRPTVVVSGGSIAGAAAAFWFRRLGWQVVLLERNPSFRTGGQNIDVRGTAREVLSRMGLEKAVREHTTTEVGTRFVDDQGATVAEFPVTADGDGLTAELEILRGDLAGLIAAQLPDDVRWMFDTTIGEVTPHDEGVEVTLDDGRRLRCDLLVVAEGVRSSTRDLILADAVQHHELGMYMVYGTIPRTEHDDHWWRWLTIPGSRQATLRPDNKGTTRATLAFLSAPKGYETRPREGLVDGLRDVFAGVGWEVPRILEGFAASDDVYVDYLTQIDLGRYFDGRVVVLGDAAWSVTPLGGGGASLALVGAYVLAASISQFGVATDDIRRALTSYEEWMRPLVKEVQDLPPGIPRVALPKSELGVALQRRLTSLASTRPLRKLATAFTSGPEADTPLPDLRQPDETGRRRQRS